jgi:histidinol-phosphate aminotransferase
MGDWFEERISALNRLDAYRLTYDLNDARVKVKLDANENWHIPTERLRRIVTEAVEEVDVRKYALGDLQELSRAVGNRLGIPEESVIPTAGGDQGIDLICQAFIGEDDRAVIVHPTYSFYKLRATLAGAHCTEISMNDNFSLPVERILEVGGDGGMVFVCSPNNPTGNQFLVKELKQLCDDFRGFIIVDEAYVHFAPETIISEVMRRRNLIVLRTFSKAFALANLRLGLIIGNPAWAPNFLHRVQYPYPISGVAANIALRLLDEYDLIEKGVESLKREKSWMSQELARFEGVRVVPSVTNFLLLSLTTDYERIHIELLRRGVATKRVGRVLGLSNCIRVTVGTREMNEVFLTVLGEVLRNA